MGCTDCERIRPGFMAQPVNTITSLALVAAGGLLLGHPRLRESRHRPELRAFAGLTVLVGLGSAAFHGPQPPGAQRMHDWPIAGLVALAAATPAVRRMRGLTALPGWNRRRGLALAAVAAAAAASYAGGRTPAPTCDPDSVLQLHGAWHVLSAGGFVLVAEILYDSVERA
jgi:hypothetical protein